MPDSELARVNIETPSTPPTSPRVLLDFDGRAVCARLRRAETPEYSTPVVLAAGGAGRGVDGVWGAALENGLAEVAPVVTYDRAGSGRSDGPQHTSAAAMAEELRRVIEGLALDEPVVIAGWSLGAFVAEAYALRYPADVVGLVFIDPTPTEPPPRSLAVQLQLAAAQPLMRALAVASWTGVFSGSLGERIGRALGGADTSEEMVAQTIQLLQSPQALNAEARVQQLVPGYSSELADAMATQPMPDVPATVISAGTRAGVPTDYVANIETSHKALAARFTRGRTVVAEDASHAVPLDAPEVIVDQVRAVLAAL